MHVSSEMRAIAEEVCLPAVAGGAASILFGGAKANVGHLEPGAGVGERSALSSAGAPTAPSPHWPAPSMNSSGARLPSPAKARSRVLQRGGCAG